MSTEQLIQRAQLLFQQDRYEQAEDMLRQALAEDPQDAFAHGLLAICMMRDRDRLKDATLEAEQAIHAEPDQAFGYYAHALVMEKRNQVDQAMVSADRAIELDPVNSTFHGMRASLLAQKKKWEECLDAAELGLQFDPEDETCASLRSLSLERLGKVGDALGEADRAVAQNPDSSQAHASRGWALLNKGDHKESQVAFREALRLDPGNEFARHGMIQALNSNNFFFRKFHGLMLMASRLDSKVQWGLIIGLWMGMRVFRRLGQQYEWLQPFVLPISLCYLLLVMMSWIAMPLFNTFLRFHPFGRFLLSSKEKWASNLIAAALGIGIVVAAITLVVHGLWAVALIAICTAIYMTIPLSVAFRTDPGWPTTVAALCAVLFGLLFLYISGMMVIPAVDFAVLALFQFGILIYCFFGQYLMSVTVKV